MRAAASNRDGELSFRAGRAGNPGRTQPERSKSLPSTFPVSGRCGNAKMDIEGGEWEILTDSRFSTVAVPVVVLEHHAHGCPSPDPRAAATVALQDAGYVVHPGEEHQGGTGILWAAHRDGVSGG